MTIVGGFDVHRKQITFDYVDTGTGLVRCGEIGPATRKTLRSWLGEHCPAGDVEIAVEGCTGWRYVVEELAAAGATAHLADPAETAGLRGSPHAGHPIHHHVAGPSSVDPDKAGRWHAIPSLDSSPQYTRRHHMA
jgi:hypothetical protein